MDPEDSSQAFHWQRYPGYQFKPVRFQGNNLLIIATFFTLILILSLLFLYALYICTCRRRRLAISDSTTHSGLSMAGLDPVTISSLPSLVHKSSSSSNAYASEAADCSICLSVFEEGEKVKVLPQCRHAFHSGCVDKWLSSHPSCPFCRSSLGS
ncbi:Zinc finger, RING-type [Dillenia turbinata]|uniref:Zinc finger, RING-type n=1 Tax=Dillenia turbinata TaxID=194707 RepID=A0AAN8ZMN7_9MAGN